MSTGYVERFDGEARCAELSKHLQEKSYLSNWLCQLAVETQSRASDPCCQGMQPAGGLFCRSRGREQIGALEDEKALCSTALVDILRIIDFVEKAWKVSALVFVCG